MIKTQEERVRVLLTLRKDYMEALDKLIDKGVASSRSELFERIVGAYLSDLKAKRQQEGALGALVGFSLLLIGAAAVAAIFGGDSE
jgi:metal-responsive CopG/Arc/MetJ family transcriptional regulator